MHPRIPPGSEFTSYWSLDPETVYLNHGSFGACPSGVLEMQTAYRKRLESQPVRFLVREMEESFDRSRKAVAGFVNASCEDLVFLQNATSAVNTVFRSVRLRPGDEIIFTNHTYGACIRILEFIAMQTGAKLVCAEYPFPVTSPDVIVEAVISRITSHTRIALIDHITSATSLIQPVETIVRELGKRGIDTMVDGAHALGSIPLDLESLGAAYYTANCHKWLCSPKSSAILHVRRDRQKEIYPLVISHAGYKAEPFTERFFWQGTTDPTSAICAGDSIDYMASLVPGGWPAIMERNHLLCLQARNLICQRLGIEKPCPDSMIAGMASFNLPVSLKPVNFDYKSFEPLQELLYNRFHIEIPVWNWDSPPSRLARISAQLYNSIEQYGYLSEALSAALAG